MAGVAYDWFLYITNSNSRPIYMKQSGKLPAFLLPVYRISIKTEIPDFSMAYVLVTSAFLKLWRWSQTYNTRYSQDKN